MYNFDFLPNRKNSGSSKWLDQSDKISCANENVVPLSVADMEFENAPEIKDGLKDYIDHTVLGYTEATDAYYDSVISWMERRHGFSPKKEWFIQSPGIVPAIKEMVGKFTEENESVLLLTPVYYPFYSSVTDNHRNIVTSELILDDGKYTIDFNDLETKAKREDVTLMIISSPHNPIGKVWTKEELVGICDICLRNNVFLISDEIHFDLIMPGYKHVSVGTLDQKYIDNCAICTAPSKTFNLAGVQVSNTFISNEKYRDKITSARGYFSLNIFAYKICEIAYNKCEQWLDELLIYLDENRKFVEKYFEEKLPEFKVHRLEGTYLMWIDFRSLGFTGDELEKFMHEKANIVFDEGYVFGDGGIGFERMNIACPRDVLKNSLERLEKAVRSI